MDPSANRHADPTLSHARRRCRRDGPLSVAGALLALLAVVPGARAGGTERVSVHTDGTGGNAQSANPSASASGRFVAFRSDATNLVPGDMNASEDVFVRDRKKGTTERVSVDSEGAEGNAQSNGASISANGRFVAFASSATNLVPGDTNAKADVFVHDRKTGKTERVSVDSEGAQANGHCTLPSISANGRFVAFRSDANNLVPGDGNGALDVFVHDRKKGTTVRVSVNSDGVEGNANCFTDAISGNGRYVAFGSIASNLVSGDGNGVNDIFVHDLKTGTTERVSVDTDGVEGDDDSYSPTLSANGRLVAFESSATNLVAGDTNGAYDVFVHDRKTGATTRASVDPDGADGNVDSYQASLSANGRWLAFASSATNLVVGDTNARDDVFVRDLKQGTTALVSVDSDGNQGNSDSDAPSIAPKGRYVAFESDASNFAPDDGNAAYDAFVHDRK